MARNSSVKARMILARVACINPSGIGLPKRCWIISARPAPEIPGWFRKSSAVTSKPFGLKALAAYARVDEFAVDEHAVDEHAVAIEDEKTRTRPIKRIAHSGTPDADHR
jgi:hypothetical protein